MDSTKEAKTIDHTPVRNIVIRLVGDDGIPDDWDAEWYTESEAIDLLAEDCSPVLPDGCDEDLADEIMDAPWEHPDVFWCCEPDGPEGGPIPAPYLLRVSRM